MNPGNEQSRLLGLGLRRPAGLAELCGRIADPAIDELISKIVFAPNRDEQVATIKALDRVLLAHHYVVPLFYSKAVRDRLLEHLTPAGGLALLRHRLPGYLVVEARRK
jgi:microcin C transport system substrate-binding protein